MSVTARGKVRRHVHKCGKPIQTGAEALGKVETMQTTGTALTCLEQGGGVGGALTVIREGRDMDQVLLTTFEHSDVAAGGG